MPSKPHQSQVKQSSLPSTPASTNVWTFRTKSIVTTVQIKEASASIRIHKVWVGMAFSVLIRSKKNSCKNGCAPFRYLIQLSNRMIRACYLTSRFSWRTFVGTKLIMIIKKWWNQTALSSTFIANFKIIHQGSQRTWNASFSFYLRMWAWIALRSSWSCKSNNFKMWSCIFIKFHWVWI